MAPIDDYDRPIMAPPPGVTSNFDNPESEAAPIVATDSVMLCLTVLCVGIRLWTKTRITRAFGADDVLCLAAFLLAIAHSVMSHLSVTVGYGRHLWDLRAVEMTEAHVRLISAQTFMYFLAIGVVKISILAFYLRVFSVDRRLARLVYGGMAVIGTVYLALTINAIVLLFACSSVGALAKQYCHDQYIPILIGALFNIISDFYVLLLPVPRVWKLQTSRKRKIGILAILTVGFIASVSSIIRLVLLGVRITSPDYLWNPGMNELNIVEMDTGIMTSCMPTFPAFFGSARLFQLSTYSSLRARFTPSGWRSSKGSSRGSSSRRHRATPGGGGGGGGGPGAGPRGHSPASSSGDSSGSGAVAREKRGAARAWYDRETIADGTLRSGADGRAACNVNCSGNCTANHGTTGRGWRFWRPAPRDAERGLPTTRRAEAGSFDEPEADADTAPGRGWRLWRTQGHGAASRGLPTTRRAEAGSFDEPEPAEDDARAAPGGGGWRLWRPLGRGPAKGSTTASRGLHTTRRAEAGSFYESEAEEEQDGYGAVAPAAGGTGRPMSFVHRPPAAGGENRVVVTAPPVGVVEPWAHGGIQKLVDYEVGNHAV